MTAHARLSPSACSRWSTCTASASLIDKLRAAGIVPERDSSVYAAEGTVAHEVRELCLEFGVDPHHFVGLSMQADGYEFTVDEDMASHLQTGIDWVREHTANPLVEIRVDLSPWLPGQFGTCDTAWIEGLIRTLFISDLKYGAGEPVDATDNKQLRLYALGAWHYLGQPDVDRVVMNIDQPRAGGMKFWEVSLDELLAFGDEMKAVYAKIASGNVEIRRIGTSGLFEILNVTGEIEFAPSEAACRWCEVKKADGGCPARNKWMLDMCVEDLEDLQADEAKLPNLLTITPSRRWQIVKHASEIRAWLASLHEDSLRAAVDGRPDPGSKAVEGDLGDRYFTDQAKAAALLTAALGDAAYKPRQLIGITDIETVVKPGKRKTGHPETWDALQAILDRAPGKPKLVPESHAKPALVRWEDEFDDL